ncbi:MAG TPA: hypothetical protein VFT29_14555 [Gemmatimonadaceae bacterium]|nr:hypothetical protein [Gemmatimonadaceae bacterium]
MPRTGVPTLDDPVPGNYIAVSAGREHTCALVTDGSAFCWGSNEFGQLGVAPDTTTCLREDRPIACKREPVAVGGGLKFLKIRAGGSHTCALGVDSRIYCWGDNLLGALGDPAVRASTTPVPILSADAFTDLAVGGSHSCGIRSDGAVFCWGANDDGQLGLSTVGSASATPLAIQSTQRFSSIAAGDRRTCARTADGVAFCWGATWVARQNGIEVTRPQGQPFRIPAPSFKSLTVGTNTTCGIGLDDRAYCWEGNPAGGLGDGTLAGSTVPLGVSGEVRFIMLSAGAMQTCALADNGSAYCWGSNRVGQLGVSPALTSRCSGASFIACSRVPIRVSGRRVFSTITAGQGDHACALTLGGNIYCWGAGGLGQRGDGRATNEWSPAKTR